MHGRLKYKPITRKDIAQRAGVSCATVTNALSRTDGVRISEKTRQRIKQLAREMGYRPDFVRRSLITKRTSTIGILQHDPSFIFSSFYQRMIFGLFEAMEPADYRMLTLFRDPEHRYLRVIEQGRVDGMIILQSDQDQSDINKVIETGIPTVVLNKRFVSSHPHRPTGCVHMDHAGLIQSVMRTFRQRGRRRILALNDWRLHDANIAMKAAFDLALQKYAEQGIVGTTVIPQLDYFSNHADTLLQTSPFWDGVLIDGDYPTRVFLRQAKAAGKQPGRDFDLILVDTVFRRNVNFQDVLCLYHQQPEQMGRHAWKMLFRLIQGESCPSCDVLPYLSVNTPIDTVVTGQA